MRSVPFLSQSSVIRSASAKTSPAKEEFCSSGRVAAAAASIARNARRPIAIMMLSSSSVYSIHPFNLFASQSPASHPACCLSAGLSAARLLLLLRASFATDHCCWQQLRYRVGNDDGNMVAAAAGTLSDVTRRVRPEGATVFSKHYWPDRQGLRVLCSSREANTIEFVSKTKSLRTANYSSVVGRTNKHSLQAKEGIPTTPAN